MKFLILLSDNAEGVEVNISTFAQPEELEQDSDAKALGEFLEKAIDVWMDKHAINHEGPDYPTSEQTVPFLLN